MPPSQRPYARQLLPGRKILTQNPKQHLPHQLLAQRDLAVLGDPESHTAPTIITSAEFAKDCDTQESDTQPSPGFIEQPYSWVAMKLLNIAVSILLIPTLVAGEPQLSHDAKALLKKSRVGYSDITWRDGTHENVEVLRVTDSFIAVRQSGTC